MTLLVVVIGGMLGAPSRLLLDQWVARRFTGAFPRGTFLINVSGSLLLGFITGLALYHHLGDIPKALIGTGFCGAYTTFSTFSYETVALAEEGDMALAFRNVAGSLVLGLLAAAAGMSLGYAL